MKKIQNLKSLRRIVKKLKKAGKKIAFTNGCFDLLHIGHIRYLKAAKKICDILIVAINSDASVKKIKGKNRPLTKLNQRMEIIASLDSVDLVTSFNQITPYKLIKIIKPDILVKGGDWKSNRIVGRDIVKSYGGKAVNVLYDNRVSTSKIIEKIAKNFK